MPLALGRNEAGGRKRCPIFRGIADCSAGTSHPRFHSVPQEPVSCTEYLFRTGKACFLHRMLLKTRRVPEEAFLSTARIFGTVGGRFRYRVPSKEQGKGPPQRSLAHRGRLPPQWSGLPCLRRDNQVINLIEVRSFRRASENASHLGCPEHRKEGGSCL